MAILQLFCLAKGKTKFRYWAVYVYWALRAIFLLATHCFICGFMQFTPQNSTKVIKVTFQTNKNHCMAYINPIFLPRNHL